MEAADTSPGFYGKFPSLGDFVGRRLPREFLDPWDQWLQGAVAASREQLGEHWLQTYLTSPLWRFLLSPNLCGPQAWAGVLMPSVDRVGRYFPLMLAAPLAEGSNLVRLMNGQNDWFARAEELLLSGLDDNSFDLDQFDQDVEALGIPGEDPASPPLNAFGGGSAWRLPLPGVDEVDGLQPALLDHLLERRMAAYSLWWTSGSERVAPGLLVCSGLPPENGYAAMLDGQWQDGAWEDWEPTIEADLETAGDEPGLSL